MSQTTVVVTKILKSVQIQFIFIQTNLNEPLKNRVNFGNVCIELSFFVSPIFDEIIKTCPLPFELAAHQQTGVVPTVNRFYCKHPATRRIDKMTWRLQTVELISVCCMRFQWREVICELIVTVNTQLK